ncbi:NUDIX hydrolase [Paractinoplanes brasiliensis]|uniref:NUDIX domain-containing protein n=1 Tax=Paractinoplanes brasiliensis TaxID=52695 RepID=A0A4R6J9H2_9ACTN|nr:NUDIX hydrolase [Actinoplanes brasiliensis]TDO32284.1 NUDIX domain-containing protein [Actinoplanes brasiliensis]GID27848.1 hypothetical protein Abr02nite_28310 [Actinoplanes brasiliensis]
MDAESGLGPPLSRIGAPKVVYTHRLGVLTNDRIAGPGGDVGTYLRWEWASSGVLIVPFDGERFHFWRMYRYPIAEHSWEFPRGAAEPGESVERTAARELAEETGYTVQRCVRLGQVFADSGLVSNPTEVVLGRFVDGPRARAGTPGAFEVVGNAVALKAEQVEAEISAGRFKCALTIASFVLARKHLEGR